MTQFHHISGSSPLIVGRGLTPYISNQWVYIFINLIPIMLIAARRLCYWVSNPRIMHTKQELRKDSRLALYPMYARKETKTGIMVLNKPDNNNNITRECADELFRFLTTYHHDHTVENVWIENKGPSFSGGADYEELLRNPDYLDRLMRLSIMVGEFNKPIFAKVWGSVRGIGAYLLPMFSTPLGTNKSSLRLDETAKGFIPIFGGSHRLSKLPCYTGLYLALTGDKLSEDEMGRLGFLRGKVRDEHTNKQIHRHLSNANLWNRHTYGPSSLSISEIRRENMIAYKRNHFQEMISATQAQIFKDEGNVYTNLALNQYRIAQTQYQNTLNPYNSFSEKGSGNLVANNYFKMKHDRPFNYLKDKGIVEEGKTHNNLLARLPVAKLIKVFSRDSVQGVLQELAKDGSSWAKNTEAMIRAKDPLAVHLTFHLIKNAEKLTWVQCLEEEYKIARRLLNISEANHIKTQSGKTLIGLKNKYSSQPIQQIPKDVIGQFLRPHQEQSQIFDHDTPSHSLIPTSEYWREFPDAGRNYLNRTFFQDYHGKFGEIEVRRFLNTHKIDYRDASYNIPKLREYMYKKMEYDRLIEMEKQRIRAIFQSEVFYSNLKKQRLDYLGQKLKSPSLSKLVSEEIKQYFQRKFNTRFEQLQKTAKIAGKESRMSIIRKYVSTLTENIVFKGRDIEDFKRQSNVRHEGIVRIDDKGSNVFEAQNKIEKQIHELKILKEAYQNNRSFEDLQKMDPNKPKPQYMFQSYEFTDDQYDLVKKDAALRLNYNTTIIPRQIVYKYRSLMEKASETSEQIAGMLAWENSDIEAIITNAPKTDLTFKQFAQQTLKNAVNIEEKITTLNNAYEGYQLHRKNSLGKLLHPEEDSSVKNLFFELKIIPRPFRAVHLALLQQVLDFYSQKYAHDGAISNIPQQQGSQKGPIAEWLDQGLSTSFTKLMKSDVEFTFSYLTILHLKDILMELQKSNATTIDSVTETMSNRYGIDTSEMNFNQFNNMFMQYLYAVLDMHEESRHRIIFPQTKMMEFLNCFQINLGNESASFEALMLLIARDRKRIRDYQNGVYPLLGYSPELNLNAVATQLKEHDRAIPSLDVYTENTPDSTFMGIERVSSLAATKQFESRNEKRLVLGFTHYLRRFEAMMQQVASNTMFLPKSLYKYHGKQTYELAKDLLKIEQNNEEWFRSKLRSAITSLLDFRQEQQKHMSEGELTMFDEQFAELFGSDLLGLVIKYECYTEQVVSKLLISDEKKELGTNDQIKSMYLEMKSEIKNPRALKMLNNLIMTEQVARERIQITEEYEYRKKEYEPPTSEQFRDLEPQKYKKIMMRTYQRLARDAFRYPDEENGLTPKNIRNAKIAIGDTENEYSRDTTFLSELKEINKLIKENDLKAELENRIKRMEAL